MENSDLSTELKDEQIWGYYVGGQRGYCVGFDPLALCENLFT
ncbi:MAG TPA: hypothetical protein VNU70_11050 [Puia sp.]|nr:hypothetical protein [Puia sp.]